MLKEEREYESKVGQVVEDLMAEVGPELSGDVKDGVKRKLEKFYSFQN